MARDRRLASAGAAAPVTATSPSLARAAGAAETTPYAMLQPERFQAVIDGKSVGLTTLRNGTGFEVGITNYGARIQQVLAPDRAGRLGDVVQGYESIEQVRAGQGSMGAFIGRFANRIAGGRFTLDGQDHQLTLNDGPNSLHGGERGSRFRVFDAKQLTPSSVEMTYVFRDGEEGYPGTLPLRVLYSVTDRNELVVEFSAVAVDKATVANFTSHAFFNLSGQAAAPILGHVLAIDADQALEVDAAAIPTGRLLDLAGTPLDFRTPAPIGDRVGEDHPQIRNVGGYDHAYVLRGVVEGGLQRAATVHEPGSGRVMEVWTTEPCLQFYSGNFLEGKAPRDLGKGGALYGHRSAFCLEPQRYPDAPNHPNFPSTTLRPGERRSGQIVYRFSTR